MTDLHHRLDGAADADRFGAPSQDWAATGAPSYVPITVTPAEAKRPWWRRGPNASERAYLADVERIRAAQFPRSLRVPVANPKSSIKTPTCRLIADAIGLSRGGDVICWDASEASGTLDARAYGRQQVEQARVLMQPGDFVTRAAVTTAVTVQPSNAHVMGAAGQRSFTVPDVNRILDVCDPHYGVQLIDTGANALHSHTFGEVLDQADALIVPTTRFADSVNRAAELLHRLHDGHAPLVSRTLIVVSDYGEQVALDDVVTTLRRAAGTLATVVHVPFDIHIAEGGALLFDRLSAPSKRAWTHAAAELTELTKGIR